MKAAVNGVRSVDLGVTDLPAREQFYTGVWRLRPVARGKSSVYLRGTGADHHLLGLHARPKSELLRIDLTAPDKAAVDALHAGLRGAVSVLENPAAVAEPGGGYGFSFQDPEGRTIRVLAGDRRHADAKIAPELPAKISHVVLASADPEKAAAFYCRHLGFDIIDRTAMMVFIRCNADHHSLAFAHGEPGALHHIAYEVKDIDFVMRGVGRMRDAGYEIGWGVGRHGPGDNVFAYFVGPDDIVIEYTAEVEQVGPGYKVRGPEDWKWPPGRTDKWGTAVGPSEQLKAAQKKVAFPATLFHAEPAAS